jgi:hypothetical protein
LWMLIIIMLDYYLRFLLLLGRLVLERLHRYLNISMRQVAQNVER